MQGFNMGRYRPPDADPQKEPFNGGRHALGVRARRFKDEGILVVRFELPFNVWCNQCEAHIGQGVRFNAQKRTVDHYHSTPIFAFRCKKTCCATWMEIRTDPKNTRYVVTEGARQQHREWVPAENGGFAIVDLSTTAAADASAEGSSTTEVDAFAQVEKVETDKERARARAARIRGLEEAATARSADPYTLNAALRNTFRQEKKRHLLRQRDDDQFRQRIGWNDDRTLVEPTNRDEAEKDDRLYRKERQRKAQSPSASTLSRRESRSSRSRAVDTKKALAERVLTNTRRKQAHPFG